MSNFTTSWVSLQEKLKEIIQAEREIPGTPKTTQKNKTTSNHNTGSCNFLLLLEHKAKA